MASFSLTQSVPCNFFWFHCKEILQTSRTSLGSWPLKRFSFPNVLSREETCPRLTLSSLAGTVQSTREGEVTYAPSFCFTRRFLLKLWPGTP